MYGNDGWDDNATVEMPANAYQYVETQSFASTKRYPDRQDSNQYERRNYNNFKNDRGDFQRRNQRGDRSNFSNEPCEEMKVKSCRVGMVIGKGGSKITELQSKSGARIQVTKENDGDETLVKLFGQPDAISKARELITELTADKILFVNYASLSEEEKIAMEKPKVYDNIDWSELSRRCDEEEKALWAQYPPINKDFYIEHKEVTRMTESEVETFRMENNNIVVDRTFKTEDSKPIPKPVTKFEHAFHNYPEILDEIYKAGFETPSPIQCQAWPVLLTGEDLIGIAQTGTGKTLAFLLPALIHIDGQGITREERGGPAVLIMAPTRELAQQIDKEIRKYQYRGITSICLYGGGDRRDQISHVNKGVDIVIATPGRLNDLVAAGHLDVKPITYVVLDEADRMLDMGFEPQIRKILYKIRPTRHTVMTSATWPPGVRRLAQSYMKDPVQVYIGSLDLAAVHTVTQIIQILPDDEDEKMRTFLDFAHNMGPEQKVIVFCGKKAKADNLAVELCMAGVECQTIHGDREQVDREQALRDITDGTVKILVATDVASRGLDIEDITHVVNYDFPRNIEEYVHRVGRTGRAGRYGESISYFTRGDWGQAKELIAILEEAQQYIPEDLYKMAERYEAKKASGGFSGRGRGRGGGRGGFGGGRSNRW